MRACAAILFLLVTVGCHRLERNSSDDLTPDEIVARSTHLFIGVIESHEFSGRWLYWPGWDDSGKWTVTRRRVRVETVVRGEEKSPFIDVYEVFPTGGVSGPWNATQVGQRYLFPVRKEGGIYRLSRDFWRSIYTVVSGRHTKLPLTDASPFWERFGLLQWIPGPDHSPAFGQSYNVDWLGFWRTAKALRGLLRHPDSKIRENACIGLLDMKLGQDECWSTLPRHIQRGIDATENRRFLEDDATYQWDRAIRHVVAGNNTVDLDFLRLLTAVRHLPLRRKFCSDFLSPFPGDRENGCDETRPLPAMIVTENGEIPLTP